MGSLHFHPHTEPILQETAKIFSFVKDIHQEIAMISSFVEEGQHEITTTSSFHEEIRLVVEVNDYHLIFNLNGVLMASIKGQIKSHHVVLKHGLKEFIFACVKKFTMYNVIDSNVTGFIHLNVYP
jgi:hypothetical protein